MLCTSKTLQGLTPIALLVFGYLSTTEAATGQTDEKSPPRNGTAQQVTTDRTADRSLMIESVVVTARKREESLQEVPLSVVAVSGEEIEQRSIDTLEDLAQGTPNFHFAEQPQSGRVAGIAFIRGVGQRDPISAYEPGVGIYVDGVYMGRMYANNLDMMDVERVEVLRGPQGTLFGKNTSGGAISIVSKAPNPSGTVSGHAQLTTGDRDRFDAVGSVNIPLVADRLALQVAGAQLKQDGYGVRADGQELSDTDRKFIRTQLLFQPTENLSALLSGDWMESDERNASFKLVDTNASIGTLVALNAATDPDYDDRWLSPKDYFYNGSGPNSARGNIWGTSFTLTYEAGWATLKSITAYRELDVHNDIDPDGAPVIVINKFEHSAQQQVSQELQAAGSALGSRLDWVAGAFYFQEDIAQFEMYNLLPALFGGARDFSRASPIENESIAAYAQGSYGLTDKLRLTAGLRYTQDEKKIQSTQFNSTGAVQFATPTGEHSSNAVSPRIGLDYQWTDNFMTYVSAAQGAKNGGFNGRVGRLSDFIEFEDEEVWTYEAGMRSDLFDDRVRFNVTTFYSKYSDLQLQISGSTIVGGAPVPFSIISNVPKANIKGGEVELSVAAAPGLRLTGGLGLTYGEYDELPTDAQFVASRVVNKDSKISHMPEVSYTLGAEYSTYVTGAINATAHIDYAHKSKIYYNAENTANLVQPAFGLLNARLTFEHASSGLSMSLFGTNLTDETYMLGGFDDAANPNPGLGFSIVTQGAPRGWGMSIRYSFD